MVDKTDWEELSNKLIAESKKDDSRKNLQRISWWHGKVLGNELIQSYSENPMLLTYAISHAKKRWDVQIIWFALPLVLMVNYMYIPIAISALLSVPIMYLAAQIKMKRFKYHVVKYLGGTQA